MLFRDLCARLPYGVKCEYDNLRYGGVYKVTYIGYNGYIEGVIDNERGWAVFGLLELKPYLFPLSSMTEEQEKEWRYTLSSDYNITYDTVDWLNKNHFDYRNLIDKNLAIDCTNLNIY